MDLHWHHETTSTNDEAKALAEQGASHGTLVGADFQTAGRGRTGKSWLSNPGDGLMCSIIVRPTWEKAHWGWIALTAGLALAELLERDCLHPAIKWPNDILVNGRKIAGILTEAAGDYAIIGIGMNLNMATLPTVDSSIQPTSFFLETDCTLDARSYAETIQTLLSYYTALPSPSALQSKIEKRLAWYHSTISLRSGDQYHTGTIAGLGTLGQLLLNTPSGTTEIYDAHEIRPLSA